MKPKNSRKIKSPSKSCDPKIVSIAISILKQLNQKCNEEKEKKSLLVDESENPILLQFTMKKIPPSTMHKFIKVRLPTSILTEKSEVCLITGDLDKRDIKAEVEPDVLHFKEFLKKENISQVNEVITLRQLRKEYKPYEAKRQLCGAYDVFLCDKRIAGVLPATLGKGFFKKRKLPIQINMQTPNLKEQILNALSTTVFHVSCKGNSCSSEVAHFAMKDEDILSNIMTSIDFLKEHLPGQWDNILGVYIKTPKSKAIPLYISNDNPNVFSFEKKRPRPKAVTAELSTLPNTDVKVFRDGRVVVKRFIDTESLSESEEEGYSNYSGKQGEINMEDFNISASDGEASDSDSCVSKKKKSEKKQKSKLGSEGESSLFEIGEKFENSEAEKVEKKKKKSESDLRANEGSSKDEVNERNVKDCKVVKPEKQSKKRKSNLELNEEKTHVKVNEETGECSTVEKHGKKSNKRKSNLGLKEESAIAEKEENVEKFEKESKKRKSNLGLKEESAIAVKEENVEKFEKESKKRKSNAGFNEENAVVAEKEEILKNSKVCTPEKRKNQKSVSVPREESEVGKRKSVRSLSLKSTKSKHKK